MDRPRVVGMAWYGRQDYARILDVMVDRNRLAGTYDAWLASAEQVAGEVERSGVEVRRVLIEPDGFVAWCAARDLPCDGAARAQFASAGLATSDAADP